MVATVDPEEETHGLELLSAVGSENGIRDLVLVTGGGVVLPCDGHIDGIVGFYDDCHHPLGFDIERNGDDVAVASVHGRVEIPDGMCDGAVDALFLIEKRHLFHLSM